MQKRNSFCAADPDPGDDILSKTSETIGTPEFPELIPKEIQGRALFLIWLEYELLHHDIIRRRKK